MGRHGSDLGLNRRRLVHRIHRKNLAEDRAEILSEDGLAQDGRLATMTVQWPFRSRIASPEVSGVVAALVPLGCANPVSLGRYFVLAISAKKPSGPDHLLRSVQPATWLAAAGVIEAVLARDKVPRRAEPDAAL